VALLSELKARQERATNAAKIPKISTFLKPADSAQGSTVDIVTVTESMSDRTSSAAAAVTLDTSKHAGYHFREYSNTVQTRMDSGNENEDISLTSTITEGDNRKTVEPISAKINPNDKANFREPLAHNDRQLLISLGPCQPLGPF
jgi:hypothetical protein